jgi:N6-L-threonylcarbamoyladenine synthase
MAAKHKYPFSIPMLHSKEIEFSFSGLKTAVRNYIDGEPHTEKSLASLAASLQSVLAETLGFRAGQAMTQFKKTYPDKQNPSLIVCGGVSANQLIRATLEKECAKNGFELSAPPLEYCTDNGAMIAWAGIELLKAGRTAPLNFKARPRWPLAELKGSFDRI